METSSLGRLALLCFISCLAAVPLDAQRGGGGGNKGGGNGGGGGGGDPTGIYRPVLIGYPGSTAISAAWFEDPAPAWTTLIDARYQVFHPDQMEESGGGRTLVRAVSARGDLTHGGGDRFVLDVREAADGSQALIAAPETVGTTENPSWFYDGGAEDDTTDHVLLTDDDFVVRRARWSRDGARIAFEGTAVVGGDAGIWVADLVLDGAGEPDALANLELVAVGGVWPSWGGDRIAFVRNPVWGDEFHPGSGDGYVVDVSVPFAPVETALGPVTSPAALSSSGDVAVYSKDLGTRSDLFLLDLATGIESPLTDAGRVSETSSAYPAFSPDDTQVVFSVNEACFSSAGCRSLAVIDVFGTGNRSVITSPFTIKVGKGRSGSTQQVGSLATAIWRQ